MTDKKQTLNLSKIKRELNKFIFFETAFNQSYIKEVIKEIAKPEPKKDYFLSYIQSRIYGFMYYDLKIKDFDTINKILDQISREVKTQ